MDEALEEFGLWGEHEVDQIHRETIFLPWLAFDYVPEIDPGGLESEPQPFALQYLDENYGALDQYRQAFIREACAQPYSFFVINDVCVGKTLGVRDIFLGRTLTVKESAASKVLQRGDIVFSRAVELEGQAIMLGLAPTVLPFAFHREILDARDDFKDRLRVGGRKFDQPDLVEFDIEIRSLYFEFLEPLSDPPTPELRNTDGEPVRFAKLYYKLDCTPQEALDGLKSLSLPEFQDEILSDAVFDADGNLMEVALAWQKRGNKTQKHWDNTLLGNINIKGDVLTAEVNSEERAERIKSENEKRLKESAAFQEVVYESVENRMEEMKNQPVPEEAPREQEEFRSRPEVQELVRKQMEAHWEAWYNDRIPALNNKTPLQAAKTKSGRERLEALLLEFERMNERSLDTHLRVDLAAMRKRLGT